MLNDKKTYQLNNKGYTLVEAIVVMGIMAILVGIMSVGISLMFSRDAQYAAVSIDDQLTETRMLSMTKSGDFQMEVHMDSAARGSYILITRDGSEYRRISLDKRDIEIQFSGGTTAVIEFDKANGSVSKVNGSTASGVYTFTITGLRGAQKEAIVTLVSATGRHYTNK